MVRVDNNVIRPRRPIEWDKIKPTGMPIFKVEGDDFQARTQQNESTLSKPFPHNPQIRKTVVHQLEKYCENTTLHGLRYVGDAHLTFGERIFWLISFSLAIGFAAYYISNIYTKWKSSPVIISFSPFDAELNSIPFPAVTICNMNQAKKDEAEKILKEGSNIEKKLLDDACNGNATFEGSDNISWDSLKKFLVTVGNSCDEMLKSCYWGSKKIDCNYIFNNDLTDEGLCCSFNRLPPDKIFRNLKDISILNRSYPQNVYDWTAEKGFKNVKADDNIIPKRPLGAGAHLGLSIILDAKIDDYYCSSTHSTGFKVILSNPIETPKMADFGFLLSPGFETRVSIEPNVREATTSLRDVAVGKRQCYFSNERPLQYYRYYTKNHCDIECYSKKVLKYCHCVPGLSPKNSNVSICELNNQCVKQITEIHDKEKDRLKGSQNNCKCLHGCFELNYSHSLSLSPLLLVNAKNGKKIANYTPKYARKNLAKLDLYFVANFIRKTEKRIISTFTDLTALIGGLLGFFTGFSLLSAVELIFHLIWKKRTEKPTENTPIIIRPYLN